ncbi:DNA polymerase Y family protein [Hamadaea sp. NPDC051192]|uniref:DNA polymerase Y family protein n=1 Tax=Hamadaea sp. NPDC051192 TaxID=3154940 RepID=UPI00342715BE
MADAGRTAVVWCPDWPVIAAEIIDGVDAAGPVIVLQNNRVLACSAAARADGVRRGMRKREAQSTSPRSVAVDDDPGRDARAFEPVITAAEEVVAGVAALRPGTCAFAVRGPARYFGGEEIAAEQVVEHIAQACGVEAQISMAEGVFAAGIAARAGRLVPAGQTAAYLAGLPIGLLDGFGGRAKLIDLLRRLGVHTLGAYAALPPSDVLARFGLDAAVAHKLAAGLDTRPLAIRSAPPDLAIGEEFEEPIDRVDVAAFAARSLAEQLHERLAAYGMACTRLAIDAVTVHGEELHRIWRHDGILTAAGIADRVRWQLEGWLLRPERPTGGVLRLTLTPDGVLRQVGLQPGLWGETGPERDRANRAATRVQGLLGPDAVLTPALGGRQYGRLIPWGLIPWGDERPPPDDRPWPGRTPAPSGALLAVPQRPVRVLDEHGEPVTIDGRLRMSAPPAALLLDGTAVPIVGWNGPWPIDDHWWDGRVAERSARLQVLLDDRAVVVTLRGGEWYAAVVFD